MAQLTQPAAGQMPSFSLVIETENLANADFDGLARALESLEDQEMSMTAANEILIIDSGDLPEARLAALVQRYPWLRVHRAAPETDYYQAKMLAARLATGAVLIYCDSDCVYEPSWLRNMLLPFARGDEIQIVAGETMTGGDGPYGTAMALAYIFPPHSGETRMAPAAQYFLNNVAFRRALLIERPFPDGLGLYRGNCAIHAYQLRQQGHVIWRQPLARARHAPPNGLTHFVWRFLLIGHDLYRQRRVLARFTQSSPDAARETIYDQPSKLGVFLERVRRLAADERHGAGRLVAGMPIVAAAVGLISLGYLITAVRPGYLLKCYERVLADAEHTRMDRRDHAGTSASRGKPA